MGEDPLKGEVSVSVDITETGIKAAARSRFVSAVDELGGNLVQLVNAPLHRKNAIHQAMTDSEVLKIEAATQMQISSMKQDAMETLAERAEEHARRSALKKQLNRDGVLLEALEDLRHTPDNGDQASGPEKVDEQFINRFQQYSEHASTEALRQNWGRVLSKEIMKPGTFSPKVLRIVDELTAPVASLFEKICAHRAGAALPRCLVGELEFNDLSSLVMAGLVQDPGLTGHALFLESAKTLLGSDVWIVAQGGFGVLFPQGTMIPMLDNILQTGDPPSVPVYLLTDAGKAISQIFPKSEVRWSAAYIEKIREARPEISVAEIIVSDDGHFRALNS